MRRPKHSVGENVISTCYEFLYEDRMFICENASVYSESKFGYLVIIKWEKSIPIEYIFQ